MIEELNELIGAMADDENLFGNFAKMMKRYYDELVAAGFTEEQAMSIVVNHKVA